MSSPRSPNGALALRKGGEGEIIMPRSSSPKTSPKNSFGHSLDHNVSLECVSVFWGSKDFRPICVLVTLMYSVYVPKWFCLKSSHTQSCFTVSYWTLHLYLLYWQSFYHLHVTIYKHFPISLPYGNFKYIMYIHCMSCTLSSSKWFNFQGLLMCLKTIPVIEFHIAKYHACFFICQPGRHEWYIPLLITREALSEPLPRYWGPEQTEGGKHTVKVTASSGSAGLPGRAGWVTEACFVGHMVLNKL